jgi:hypothetical protein
VAGADRHLIYIQTKEDGRNNSTLSHSSPHSMRECGSLEWRLKRVATQVGCNNSHKVRRKVEESTTNQPKF